MKIAPPIQTVLATFAILISACGSAPSANASHANSSTSAAAPTMPRTVGSRFTVSGNGFADVHFGQSESIVISKLTDILGPTSKLDPVPAPGNCTIDSYLNWPAIIVYFDRNRFVGYATGNLIGEDRLIPDVTTKKGLKIGDTVAEAKAIYGNSFQTSYAQGGSWLVTTSKGKLAGYLTEEVGHTNPPPQIADITAGSVGCPAASP